MASIDWLVVTAYLVVVAWLGTRLARRQTSTEAYFMGEPYHGGLSAVPSLEPPSAPQPLLPCLGRPTVETGGPISPI